jgi:hypothetical protein
MRPAEAAARAKFVELIAKIERHGKEIVEKHQAALAVQEELLTQARKELADFDRRMGIS